MNTYAIIRSFPVKTQPALFRLRYWLIRKRAEWKTRNEIIRVVPHYRWHDWQVRVRHGSIQEQENRARRLIVDGSARARRRLTFAERRDEHQTLQQKYVAQHAAKGDWVGW